MLLRASFSYGFNVLCASGGALLDNLESLIFIADEWTWTSVVPKFGRTVGKRLEDTARDVVAASLEGQMPSPSHPILFRLQYQC